MPRGLYTYTQQQEHTQRNRCRNIYTNRKTGICTHKEKQGYTHINTEREAYVYTHTEKKRENEKEEKSHTHRNRSRCVHTHTHTYRWIGTEADTQKNKIKCTHRGEQR